MRTRSSCLFHFTKEMGNLTGIIENGFWPSYVWEDIAWLGEVQDVERYVSSLCIVTSLERIGNDF